MNCYYDKHSGSPPGGALTEIKRSAFLIVRKGKLKIYRGKIPEVDVEEAVSKARHYTRL